MKSTLPNNQLDLILKKGAAEEDVVDSVLFFDVRVVFNTRARDFNLTVLSLGWLTVGELGKNLVDENVLSYVTDERESAVEMRRGRLLSVTKIRVGRKQSDGTRSEIRRIARILSDRGAIIGKNVSTG